MCTYQRPLLLDRYVITYNFLKLVRHGFGNSKFSSTFNNHNGTPILASYHVMFTVFDSFLTIIGAIKNTFAPERILKSCHSPLHLHPVLKDILSPRWTHQVPRGSPPPAGICFAAKIIRRKTLVSGRRRGCPYRWDGAGESSEDPGRREEVGCKSGEAGRVYLCDIWGEVLSSRSAFVLGMGMNSGRKNRKDNQIN